MDVDYYCFWFVGVIMIISLIGNGVEEIKFNLGLGNKY